LSRDDFLKEEFSSLRNEIMVRQSQRFKILVGGMFGVPAYSAFGKIADLNEVFGLVFMSVSPLIVLCVLLVYISEINGVMRIGRYIHENIESHFGPGWETWLESDDEKGRRMFDSRLNAAVFFCSILYYFGSSYIFLSSFYSINNISNNTYFHILIIFYISLGFVGFYWAFRCMEFTASPRES